MRYVARWKATEYRLFLLYAGPLVMKELLATKRYKHFLLLHVASRILCSDKLCKKLRIKAKEYLTIFFKFLTYYGETAKVLNPHHLIHVAEDVLHMKCSLSRISAFPFESLLGKMKKCLRTANKPLAQLCRRLHEHTFLKNAKPNVPEIMEILEETDNSILKLRYKQFVITNSSPNNVILLKDKSIVRVSGIILTEDNVMISGNVWNKRKSIFNFPLDSSLLNMWELQNDPLEQKITFELSDVSCKLVCLRLNFQEKLPIRTYIIPLLHD